jgi:predicted RNA polymerase sigma factor
MKYLILAHGSQRDYDSSAGTDDAEVTGLPAPMLLTDARAPARLTGLGEPISLHEQDRALWKAGSIRRGVDPVTRRPGGP